MTALPSSMMTLMHSVTPSRERVTWSDARIKTARAGDGERDQAREVLGAHVLRGGDLSGGVELMSAATMKLASLQMVAWRLKWLGDLATRVVSGALTPVQAFARVWETQDVEEWCSSRALTECLFDAVSAWQGQRRYGLAASFQGLVLRMGLCSGKDRLVVRSLKELTAIERSDPDSVALAVEPGQLNLLRGAWLAEPTEKARVEGPNPGRFEWMLSRVASLSRPNQRAKLLSGLREMILFYAEEGSGVALNLRSIALLPRWAEIAVEHDEQVGCFGELLDAIESAAARLREEGIARSDLWLDQTLSGLWALVSERWRRRPELARLALARARTSRRANAQRLDPSVFMGVHLALSHAYQVAEDQALCAQIRVEWMANHIQWLTTGERQAEDYARSLLTVVSGGPHSALEAILSAELYLLIEESPALRADYARRAQELSSHAIADSSEEEQAHLPRALMLHGLARLVLAECADGDPADALVSLRRAQAMLRVQLAEHPDGPARLMLASTLIGLARGHLMMAEQGEGSPEQRRTMLLQGAEYCQRARVLAQVAEDTLLRCQAVWMLGRIMSASPGPERLDAQHKGLALTVEAMELLGVTFGTAAVRGVHTAGRTLSECLIHQYLGLVQLLGRYQLNP